MEQAKEFGIEEEKAIVSLALESPEFFNNVMQYVEPDVFRLPECKIVMSVIRDLYDKHETIPPKAVIKDFILRSITTDADFEPILTLIDRKCDPREVPVIKELLVDWARDKAFGMLFSEGLNAYENRDYSTITKIIEEANRITDKSAHGVWFFENMDDLFIKDTEVKHTTGFRKLDRVLNEGGPTKKEVVCWMAPTGVGKSLVLVSNGVNSLRDNKKVLHITLEMSEFKVRQRYAQNIANTTKVALRLAQDDEEQRQKVLNSLNRFKNSFMSDLVVYEWPPDEISVNEIHNEIDFLRKTKGWEPDVVIIDYLELMVSRHGHRKSDNDYSKQKSVSTELRGLAKKENVLLFTAIQTNRPPTKGGKGKDDDIGEQKIELDRVAESYGKLMPLDYVVSLNQTPEQYQDGVVKLYVAKNRNGPKFKTITCSVKYDTMRIAEVEGKSIIDEI